MANDSMTVKISPHDKGNPPGKLADAELHFTSGPLEGLIGFGIWERRGAGGRNVTFPARQYAVNGERRSFALLRPITDTAAEERVRDLVLEANAEYEATAAASPSLARRGTHPGCSGFFPLDYHFCDDIGEAPLPITRDSHYIPQATLRRWSEDGNNLWAYRLLVSHENVSLWELKSIKGLVFHYDLYTTFSGDIETDEFERFITSIEEPGQMAIEKLLAHSKMQPSDWQAIAKFVAAQSMRTPLAFVEMTRRAGRHAQEALEKLIKKYEAVGAIVHADEGPTQPNFLRDTMKVSIEPAADPEGQSAIRAEMKSARSVWMALQRHHLTNNVHHLTAHRWRAASPFGDEEWPLADHPVLTLNYFDRTKYDFEAGWGKVGSEFILPISPKVALYTKVGDRATGAFTLSAQHTQELQRIMAERAFRWILARRELPWVTAAHPREVNAQRFEQERHFWREWNPAQSQAEADF